jgi:hypothetical protein
MRTLGHRTARGLAAATLAALAACGSGGGRATQTISPAAVRPHSAATIRIVSPEPGATVPRTGVVVRVELQGGRIVQQTSTNLRPDEGHIHVKLDGTLIDILAGLERPLPPLAPGPHIVEVEFVAVDHGPFNPRVIATVTFTAT